MNTETTAYMSQSQMSGEQRIQRILVPTDFEDASLHAFEYALQLAKILGAELKLLHVYQDVQANETYIPPSFVASLRKEKTDKAYKQLDEYVTAAQAKEEAVQVSCMLRSGRAAPEIVEAASEANSDLIIMGTEGSQSRSAHILGSVAAEAIQRAGCPVLIVPTSAEIKPIGNMMYALGLESNDPAVIGHLSWLADAIGSKLICTNIQAQEPTWQEIDWTCIEMLEKWEERGRLAFAIHQREEVIQGLMSFIEDYKIDLIVMKTHHHRIGAGQDSNSLTQKMLMATAVPLLVFREQ